MTGIKLLDCTLRDGAYIVDADFGGASIRGIIQKLQEAKTDIIECGWLKDKPYQEGTTFFHLPQDLENYLDKDPGKTYVAMIDWDRYDLSQLPPCDGKSIDAIRIVFPREHFAEGIALGGIVKEKGYDVYFQAANTLGYSDEELLRLAEKINEADPVAISIVDTFGAMYEEDLERIYGIMDAHVSSHIKLGFHSHNNQQLSFALSMRFADLLEETGREGVIDSSLCGMGRGAGNATTELVASYLNRKHHGNYDLDAILDAIDTYMAHYQEKFSWGYSTPYFISGMYCTHVNNIAYLTKNHRSNAKTMRSVIASMQPADRLKYDYDLLEEKYMEYQNQYVDDNEVIAQLKQVIGERAVLLVLPGKNAVEQKERVEEYIGKENPVVIGVNAATGSHTYDYIFFATSSRYEYALSYNPEYYKNVKCILGSNIKNEPLPNEIIVNYNQIIKRGWDHYDNAGIMCLRLLNRIGAKNIAIAGFDGFTGSYESSYADSALPHIDPGKEWKELNQEIQDMLTDFRKATNDVMKIEFLTDSIFG